MTTETVEDPFKAGHAARPAVCRILRVCKNPVRWEVYRPHWSAWYPACTFHRNRAHAFWTDVTSRYAAEDEP